MRRRVPLQKLRGSDPTLLVVQLQDLFTRPSGQIYPENLCDLFALSELEDIPRSVRTKMKAFLIRARGEISEFTDGAQMREFTKELSEIDPEKIPTSMRELLAELADRKSRDSAPFREFLATLEGTVPLQFELGEEEVRVQRAEEGPRKSHDRRRAAPKSPTAARKKATPRRAAKPVMDVEKAKWISSVILERLSGSKVNGLMEVVLIAGVRHRAKTEFPNMLPQDVTTVLNSLLKAGRVRKSAGRWFIS